MIDYKQIANDDPGGSIEDAYNTLAATMVTTYPEKRITYLTVADQVGADTSMQLEKAVVAAINAGAIPKWSDQVLISGGIDVNDPQSAGLLTLMTQVNGGFTAEMAANVLTMGAIKESKYKNLKPGHVQNAREKRAEGLV